MDFAKLQIFYTVANISNISTASEQLHMSRQNISKVLRQLEQELDCQLLVRTSSGVRLTEKVRSFWSTSASCGNSPLHSASSSPMSRL